ncbi:MAG: CopG family ribbon-helix-helix protein [Armatimonadota bacterium]
MGKKVQVVLDDETYDLLQDLAGPRAGNKSFVVREALRHFADREQLERILDAVLGQRHAKEAMEAGIAAQRAGRLVPHAAVIKRLRRRPGTG